MTETSKLLEDPAFADYRALVEAWTFWIRHVVESRLPPGWAKLATVPVVDRSLERLFVTDRSVTLTGSLRNSRGTAKAYILFGVGAQSFGDPGQVQLRPECPLVGAIMVDADPPPASRTALMAMREVLGSDVFRAIGQEHALVLGQSGSVTTALFRAAEPPPLSRA